MHVPTLRDGDLVLRPKRRADTGELVGAPRGGVEEPVYAVYTRTAP